MTAPAGLDGTDPSLLAAVARLLATSVPTEAAGLVPYSLPEYHRYLARVLAPAPPHRTVLIRVVKREAAPVAVADWRVLGSTLFLNGLAVDPEHRGGGLGRRLVDDGADLARALGAARLALDVADGNAAARALYDRAGFLLAGTAAWHRLPVGAPGPDPEVRVLDWPVFAACRDAYGFAELTVRGSGGVPVTARVTGTAIRVPASGPTPARWCALSGCDRAWTADGAPGRPFLRFVRMTRAVA